MATVFIRLTVYDPKVMTALESLKRSRKQSAFVVEALRHFLAAENGQLLLQSMIDVNKSVTSAAQEESPISILPSKSSSGPNLDDIFRR